MLSIRQYFLERKKKEDVEYYGLIIFFVCLPPIASIIVRALGDYDFRGEPVSVHLLWFSLLLPAYILGNYIFKKREFLGIFPFDLSKEKLICPKCLATIKLGEIKDITCPFCKESGKNYNDLIYGCDCDSIIREISCPHCGDTIDMFQKYDEQKLRLKRYE